MYQKILVALDATAADESLLPHVRELAQKFNSELLLVHVADGWAARHFGGILQPAESEEMKTDRAYLETAAIPLRAVGLQVTTQLALGDPPREILRVAEKENCDLIAMTTHGHRLLGDIIFGSTIEAVRHRAHIPLLLVRAERLG
ncbi:MAG TPA: universal stress protein [Opitutaceae bacterium]|nr:universal stress protein [Opitutaceae bacterium]